MDLHNFAVLAIDAAGQLVQLLTEFVKSSIRLQLGLEPGGTSH